MKTQLKHILFILCSLLVSSCGMNLVNNPMIVFPEEIKVRNNASEYEFEYHVEAGLNGAVVKASTDVDWIENIEVTDTTVKFNVLDNPTSASRSGHIRLSYPMLPEPHETLVIQTNSEIPLPESEFQVFSANGVEFTMIKVDGGTFSMGATPEQGDIAQSIERPVHEVTLSDYLIGQTNVTHRLWKAVMGSDSGAENLNGDTPVGDVSWNVIVSEFLPKLYKLTGLFFTLPTEAQWEFAARGGNKSQGYKYSGSNNLDEVAWYYDNCGTLPQPVAQKIPNELGIYDMSGNVNEWCFDRFGEYVAEAQTDPLGPITGTERVLRGGNYIGRPTYCRVSNRYKADPTVGVLGNSFRLVLNSSGVLPPPVLNLNKSHLTLLEGSSETLVATITPEIASDIPVIWLSSQPSVASVDGNGKVTALSPGTTTITATTESDAIHSSCEVRVDKLYPGTTPFVANGIQFNMIKVDGGTFTMGGTPEQGQDANDEEKPTHQVTLSDYYIGQYEVTRELWNAVMGSSSTVDQTDPHCPVAAISWNDIVDGFLPALNALTGQDFSLPTEAQWEFAARGGIESQGKKFSGSNDFQEVAWVAVNSDGKIHPVGQKLPNELGLYDMSGNVNEWCGDWYGAYSATSQTDPTGPQDGTKRVLRSGSFGGRPAYSRVSNRYQNTADFRMYDSGLRLVLNASILQPSVPVESISLNRSRMVLIKGNTERLYAIFSPENASEQMVRWESSQPSIATVDQTGMVTAKTPGTATITATTVDGSKQATCELRVDKIYPGTIPYTVKGVTFNMIKVAGGTFSMGLTPDQGGYENESPVHQVTLSDYQISQFEVTQELWTAVMGTDPSYGKGYPKLPIIKQSWNDIVYSFLPKLNALTGQKFNLPTEAQWEFAARGGNIGERYTYCSSNNIDDVAWYQDNSSLHEQIVGQKNPNGLGIYDMSGNADEWCRDWYDVYSAEAQTNPTGPETGTSRVLRGGNCNNDGYFCRVCSRYWIEPENDKYSSGIRLVLETRIPVQSIRLNSSELTLTPGNSERLYATISPENASDRNMTWTSSQPSVASVDQTGRVTANTPGTTTITATTRDGGKKATCQVIVKNNFSVKTFTVGGVHFKMMPVEGGNFMMGATPEQESNVQQEQPVHQVTLSDYYMAETEVTQELWQAVMGSNPSKFSGDLRRPVESVSWNTIVNEFLPKLNSLTGMNFTLPTEAQWEYAARGGNKTQHYKYSGSNNLSLVAQSGQDSAHGGSTHPVGQKQSNELGIYDMSGNVNEWCMDWSGRYSSDPQTDPTGPVSGSERIARGGNWSSSPVQCRVANRPATRPDLKNIYTGFRLALDK